MNKLKKTYYSIKASFHWGKSIDFASENNYSDALKEILKSESYCAPVFPAGVIKVLILLKNEKHEEVIAEANHYLALTEIDKSFNEDEKKYMRYYINDLAKRASDALNKKWEVKEQVDIKDINVSNVSDTIKRWYPI